MLIAVGAVVVAGGLLTSAGQRARATKGIRPDRTPDEPEPDTGVSSERPGATADEPPPEKPGTVSRGIRPDRPAEKSKSGEGN
jgi:hypothetical protein